jgi:membrane-bound lytic murein transglycosylase D
LRREAANKLVRKQMLEIRYGLKKLARRKSFENLSSVERELYDRLISVEGPRKRVFRMAAAQVRSQLGQKDFFQRGLVNSSRYLPYMEEEFKRIGLPVELTRMPFVESSFNEEARSKVGASGIWQIMPRTGKAYMIVNERIDERNSPLKATAAAGRLLQSYNRAMQSWPLTITSYNHGIGNIQKAVKAARSRDLATIIARYHQGDFKFASSNFYTCFLAALYAEKYHELIFKEIPREPLLERETLKLAGTTGIRYLEKVTAALAAGDPRPRSTPSR